MKKAIMLFSLVGLLLTGCQNKTGTGALTGGAMGTVTGAMLGGTTGALVGGAFGAISGGMIGESFDEQDQKIMQSSATPAVVQRMEQGSPITVSDVIKLSQDGISDTSINRYIERSHTKYNLSQSHISQMQRSGVSQRVINFMVETSNY